MKVYLIKDKATKEVNVWSGTIKDFMIQMFEPLTGIAITDGERRTMANTRKRGTYYKGYKVLYYGEEKPEIIKDDVEIKTYKGENIKRLEAIERTECKEMSKRVKEWFRPSEEHQPIEFYKQGIIDQANTEPSDSFKKRSEKALTLLNKLKEHQPIEFYKKEVLCDWDVKKLKRNILFIPDLHCPFDYAKGVEIAKRIYKEENCTEVVFLGDVLDFYTISEYGHSPDFMGQSEEIIKAKEHLKGWHDAFPIAKVCTGNHTMRIKNKIEKAGLSSIWMNDFRTMFGLEGWDFQLYHELGKFIATHGMGQNVKSRSKDLHKSVISGHMHSKFEANYNDGLWAIYGGCVVDIDSRAFEYGKFFKLPKLGFVVIKDIENNAEVKMIPIKYEREGDYNKMEELW